MECSVEMVRAATPSPPVVAPPRLPTRAFDVLPAAISACAPSMSPSLADSIGRLDVDGTPACPSDGS
ncbi:MAG TPA: hypothetical protein VN809_14865 [Telmatospirillum sp.]|nr:hypothetical protein [Telmatospirillum sp.]